MLLNYLLTQQEVINHKCLHTQSLQVTKFSFLVIQHNGELQIQQRHQQLLYNSQTVIGQFYYDVQSTSSMFQCHDTLQFNVFLYLFSEQKNA